MVHEHPELDNVLEVCHLILLLFRSGILGCVVVPAHGMYSLCVWLVVFFPCTEYSFIFTWAP